MNQTNKPIVMNLDKARKYLNPTEAFYLLNHERNIGAGISNLGKTRGLNANYPACDMEVPAGENYAPNTYYSPLTNETYAWVYNSNGVHYILRTSEKGCEIVYDAGCLELSPDPKHEITQFRAYMKYDRTCKNMHGKYLVWTDGKHDIGMLDVEASIATNGFATPFFERGYDGCPLKMYVPQDCGCIQAEFIPIEASEAHLTNHIIDVAFKFMYRHVYYDGRTSEWSDPSKPSFQNSKGCLDTVAGYSRCLKLTVPLGNAFVDKIEIAYNRGGDNWYLTEVVDKYKQYNDSQQMWYERDLAELFEYDETNNTFSYKFCNDKQCEMIDPADSIRVYNPIPREAQGLIPIKGSLGFYNYKAGSCILSQGEVQKFDINIEQAGIVGCEEEFVTVKVRAIVHNFGTDRNQPVFRMGEDGSSGVVRFGGINKNVNTATTNDAVLELEYGQEFSGKVENFIAYVDGTDYWAEMKQYKANAWFKNRREVGVVKNMSETQNQKEIIRATRQGDFFFQEAEFRFPRGMKGFIRLASHEATGNEQNTSTFVRGLVNDLENYKGNHEMGGGILRGGVYEIYFDTCDGKDKDITQAFLIEDHAYDGGLSASVSTYSGYITNERKLPLELVEVGADSIGLQAGVFAITDHNGFYHFHRDANNNDVEFSIRGEVDCNTGGTPFETIYRFTVPSIEGSHIQTDVEIKDADLLRVEFNNFYATTRVTIRDCEGQGVQGIRVAMSGSKYSITNAYGVAEWKLRNRSQRNRRIRVAVVDSLGCFGGDCLNKCNGCLPSSNEIQLQACFNTPNTPVVIPAMVISRKANSISGGFLKSGGRYGFGFVAEGGGRISSVYPIRYLDIPKQQEGKGNYRIKYTDLGMKLPDWATCVKIVRTENMNPYELQWVVDDFERENRKIKITIQSLSDYNEQHLFKTNTVYGFLKGDRVEFIRNGDGKLFVPNGDGVLNYLTLSPFHNELVSGKTDAPADFFNQILIEDDGRLDDLEKGAVIEIQRRSDCVNEPVYYSICASIPVDEDGYLMYNEGEIETFDTFQVRRKIGSAPAQTFEHFAPSDFWEGRLNDQGKGFFVNQYEDERRYGRSITLNSPMQFNRFGDLVKTFSAPDQGDIIAMGISDGSIILAICEHDNFLAQAADDLARVGADGILRALSSDQIISDAQPKISGRFGCQYPHVGSIFFGDAYATWVDVNSHSYIKHDYSSAKPICEGKVNSYISARCQEIESHNRRQVDFLNHFRFATGRNNETGAVHLTIKTLRQSAYNNEKAPYRKPNETILVHPESEDWLGFASFTPEGYSRLNLFDGEGCAFISYYNGIPYIHPVVSNVANEFYGMECDRVVGISLNKYPEKIKRGLAIELQDEMMWFAAEVTTEMARFRSEIPPIRWKRNEDKWNSEFLRNLNSRGGLYEGEVSRGYSIDVIFVRDNTIDRIYNSRNPEKMIRQSELDLIIFHFQVSENSGLTEK